MNAPVIKRKRMALDDFEELLADKPEHEKWELLGGRVVKLQVGARIEHHFIIDNVQRALGNYFQAKGMPCRAFRETFWLKDKSLDLGAFPDIMVRCGPFSPGATHFEDPIVLVEVTSPGGEERDWTAKRVLYQQLASLKHYVLIARDEVLVDVHTREGDSWRLAPTLKSLDDVLRLPAIGFEMAVREVYRDVIGGDEAGRGGP